MNRAQAAKALNIISRAWGPQVGYCFFPYIDRDIQEEAGVRRAGFREGPAFQWPKDREKIIKHMVDHQDHDLYWCPSLFETDARREEEAWEEWAMWADLDEADPRDIEAEYKPTIAWETSPGRYQALWIQKDNDIGGASWPGRENQRLTYYLGADLSGWDTVQLLRIPGWENHKVEYRDENGNHPKGKLLWDDGPLYLENSFNGLPEVKGAPGPNQLSSVLAKEIEAIDRAEVIGRIRLKLNHRARELLGAREASGDRSDSLWYLTRCLADVGCTVQEIVAIVRPTPWNKFEGRNNELHTLISEATKAIAKRPEKVEEELEEEAHRPDLISMTQAFQGIKEPVWLIDGILTEGAVGFIAGQPKSFKSWLGLDMAISVATGAPFLDYFRVKAEGPVLYIQEEDPAIILRSRSNKIWSGKSMLKVHVEKDGTAYLMPKHEMADDYGKDIAVYIKHGFTVSEQAWQVWIDDRLAEGWNGKPYKLLVIDTLMMTAGDVEENKAQQMTTKVFKPLKMLANKHKVATIMIHHMKKGGNENGERGGQRMLGSVANHAWSEDSLYLSHTATGAIAMDFESKTAPGARYMISGIDKSPKWEPIITPEKVTPESSPVAQPKYERRASNKADHARRRARERGQTGWSPKDELPSKLSKTTGRTIQSLCNQMGLSRNAVRVRLHKAEAKGLVIRDADNKWRLK